MNVRAVLRALSGLLGLVGALMAACGGVSWGMGDAPEAWRALLGCGAGVAAGAGLLRVLLPGHAELSRRDGVGVVAFGWLAACAAGALPFRFSGAIPAWAGAFFESASGFTTTGATVLEVLEEVPKGLLLWRAVTQLLGGVGVLVLLVAILPMAGAGGSQLFRAELPGPTKDRVAPRIANNAKILWGVYLILVAALVAALRVEMGWFDAVCHAFSTISTGGFSTRTASVGAFGSAYVEWVVTAFMFLGACNFTLHWRTLRGGGLPHWRDGETRFYAGALALAAAVAAAVLWRGGERAAEAVRHAAFTVVSISTSTGFCTADFDLWPAAVKAVLFGLMLMGGVAGSTAGGIKVGRVQVALAAMRREIRRFTQPRAVMPLRYGKKSLDESLLLAILGFVALFFALLGAGTLAMVPMMPDMASAASAVAAALANTGPGFGAVGPTANYAAVPAAGQWVLSALMIAGRLELFTALAVFLPSFWRK